MVTETVRFRDRVDAGRRLAEYLLDYADRPDVLVLGLPRGGLLVAREVAIRLRAELDVLVVRKLGVPGHPELAMGAIAPGGVEVLSEPLILELGIPRSSVDEVARRERVELQRREESYRRGRGPLAIENRPAILVDDGLATGATMRAAVLAVRQQRPSTIVVAVPVGARESCDELAHLADRVVCASMPDPFTAVGLWYEDFSQTTDEEVRHTLSLY
jgi:predicted phosphoribosyltransferase